MYSKNFYNRQHVIVVFITLIFCGKLTAQVGIGTSTPHQSSILDIVASNKGVSFPNVELTSENDTKTIEKPEKGLIIYNPNSSHIPQGIYYNGGTTTAPNWLKIKGSSSSEGVTIAKQIGVYGDDKTVSIGDIEFRVNTSNTPQFRSIVGKNLTYATLVKQFWVSSDSGRSTDTCSNQTLHQNFRTICGANGSSTKELNDIWVFITTDGHQGTYQYIFNLLEIDGIKYLAQLVKKY